MKKTNYFIPLSLILAISLLSFVAATTSLNSPITGSNHTTTLNFTCTTNVAKALNASLYYNVTGGAVSIKLVTVTNTSAAQTVFANSAVSISSLTAASTYNMSCYTSNTTTAEWSAGVKSVLIDNTNPVCAKSASPGDSIDYMSPVTLTCSCTDNLDSSPTITRILTKPNLATVSTSDSSHIFSGSDTNIVGRYTYTCTAVDDASNSNTVTYEFPVESDDEGTIANQQAVAVKTTNTKLLVMVFAGILIVVIITIVIVALVTKSK